MSDPGVTRPDLCPVRAAAGQAEPAGAARGGFSADGCPPACDYPPAPRRAAPAAPSACPPRRPCSPWRASRRMSPTGTRMRSSGPTARPGSPPGSKPAMIDRLVYASSMLVLYAARHRVPVPSLARRLLGLGIAATLTANMAQGWSHGPVGAAVAAWPAVSLVGSYELLVWLIRTSGAAGGGAVDQSGAAQAGEIGVAVSGGAVLVDIEDVGAGGSGGDGQVPPLGVAEPGGDLLFVGGGVFVAVGRGGDLLAGQAGEDRPAAAGVGQSLMEGVVGMRSCAGGAVSGRAGGRTACPGPRAAGPLSMTCSPI